MDAILTQITLSLRNRNRSPVIEGKRHELKVELTKEAAGNHKGVRLRYRPEYIPVREAPAWAH